MKNYLQWFPRVMVRNPSWRARSTSQKPDSSAPVQVIKTSALVRRHRSPLICCTTLKGIVGQRSGNAERREWGDELVAMSFALRLKYLPLYRGSQQLDEFDLLNSRNRPRISLRATTQRSRTYHTCPLIPVDVAVESHLEGGGLNRRNLKFTTLNTHYKPGLALEQKLSPGERGQQIKWKSSEWTRWFVLPRFGSK
jgi:hypothetical protein